MGTTSSNNRRKPSQPVGGSYPAGQPTQQYAQPQQQPAYPGAPPPYNPAAGQPAPYQLQQHRTSEGTFDQGARFDGSKPVHVPPPPPGCAPTAAQMAVAQGQPVVMNQQKRDVWGMGADGGYTII